MKGEFFGYLLKPVIVMVGSWDPLTEQHTALISKANRVALDRNQELLLVVLDPFPSNFLLKRITPIFDSPQMRIRYLLSNINGGACLLELTREDVDGGLSELLFFLKNKVAVKGLWLNEKQSLGRGSQGTLKAVGDLCNYKGIKLEIFKDDPHLKTRISSVRFNLKEGNFSYAVGDMGRFPCYYRPINQTKVLVGWKQGIYRWIEKFENYAYYSSRGTGTLTVCKDAENNTFFEWPNSDIECIAITEKI